MLTYPLHFNSIDLKGPTLIYIDQEGSPIQLGLTDEQVQTTLDGWNAAAILESEIGEKPHQLKPPLPRESTCTCHKFIRLHDGYCEVHGVVRKQEAAECGT